MSARRKGKPQQRKKIETLEPEQDYLTCGDCQREFLLSDILKFIQHKVNRCKKENVDSFSGGDGQYEDDSEDKDQSVSSSSGGGGVINVRRTSISAPIAGRRGTPEAGSAGSATAAVAAAAGSKLSPRAARSLSTGEEAGTDNEEEDMDADDDGEHTNKTASENGDGASVDVVIDDKLQQNGLHHDRKASRLRRACILVDVGVNTTHTGKGACEFGVVASDDDDSKSTTVREPTSFHCCSCKQAYNAAWNLLQHVQFNHGMKIYEDRKSRDRSPRDPSPRDRSSDSHHHHHREGTPNSKASPSPSKSDPKLNKAFKREISENSPTPKQKEERPSGHQLPTNFPHSKGVPPQPKPASTPPTMSTMNMDMSQGAAPFMFRMPTSGDRNPISPVLVPHSPFNRPPHEFRLDLMNNDPFQRMPNMPLSSGFEHQPAGIPGFPAPFERPHLRHPLSPAVPLDTSAQDFYSQRLRLLASAGTSDTPASPSTKVPPSLQPFTTPPTTTSPEPAGDTSPKSSSGPATPGKAKACEFCGKLFRFQSNLIVHRRSHTGEKPFKCPMCPHACTQASKLKRHMKTHSSRHQGLSSSLSQASSMSTGSDNSMRSSSSTPDSKHGSKHEGEEDSEESDSEDEERAMEEARKMGAIQDEPTDLSTPTSMAKKLQFSYEDDSNETPTDLSVGEKEARASLLSEVMEKTGLGSIQAYKEAFNQAVAESTRRQSSSASLPSKSPVSGVITENGHTEGENSGNENNNRSHSRSSSRHGDNDSIPESKRIKVEPQEQPHNSVIPAGMDTYFSRIWFPPPPGSTPRDLVSRDLFMGMGGIVTGSLSSSDHSMNPTSHAHHENGLHASHHQGEGGSGYSVDSLVNSPKPSTSLNTLGLAPSLAPSPTVSNPSPLSGVVRSKEQRRNDTCEFCGKVFKNCSNLTVHRRSHTGEKPYRCRLCSYACAQSSKLTRHMKTHGRMGKDVYRCKFCNMPFSVPSTLEKHMRKCVENQQNAGSVSASSTPGTNSIASADSPALFTSADSPAAKVDNVD